MRSYLLSALGAAFLLSLRLAPPVLAQTACGSYAGQEVIIDVVNGPNLMRVNVYTVDGILRYSETVDQNTSNPVTGTGCGLLIETNNTGSLPTGADTWVFGNPFTQPELRLLTVEFLNETTANKPELLGRYTYNVCQDDDKLAGLGFYCSMTGNTGNSDDRRFRYDVAQGKILVQPDQIPLGSFDTVADYFPGEEDAWILPYGLQTICDAASGGSTCYKKDVFVSPIHGDPATSSIVTPIYRDWTLPNHDLVVPSFAVGTNSGGQYRGYVWGLGGKTVSFQPNRRLVVEGEFTSENATLTAADPANGWYGIRATGSAAEATLDGTSILEVDYSSAPPPNPNTPFPPYAAVTATSGATVTLDNSSLIDDSQAANGIVASLTGSLITVSGGSIIEDNNGLGALASAGARIVLTGELTQVRSNTIGGIWDWFIQRD